MFAMSTCRCHDANFRFRFHSAASSPRPLTLRVVLLVSALVCLSRFLFLRHVYYHPSTVFVKLAAFCPIVRTSDHRGAWPRCPTFGRHLIELLQISEAGGVLIPLHLTEAGWTLPFAVLCRNATLGLSSLGGAYGL